MKETRAFPVASLIRTKINGVKVYNLQLLRFSLRNNGEEEVMLEILASKKFLVVLFGAKFYSTNLDAFQVK